MDSNDKSGLWFFGIIAATIVAISLIVAWSSKPLPQKPCGCSCAEVASQTEASR